MDPHLFWLPAEKGRDGPHYALLQSRADVKLGCLLNTLQCPARLNKDDEISLISEQERVTSICVVSDYLCSTVSKVTFEIAQRFSMDNALPALHKCAL